MRTHLLLVCLIVLFAECAAFGYSDYQLPSRHSKRERYYKTVGRTVNILNLASTVQYRTRQCFDKTQCESLSRVSPVWRFRAAPLDTFKPLNKQVLIAYDQDDEGNAYIGVQPEYLQSTGGFKPNTGDNGLNQDPTTQGALYTGIVVSAAKDIVSPNVTEGARVYFSQRCTVRWTVATWTAIYGSGMAQSMDGKYKNGVDLNNAEAWVGRTTNPMDDTAFPFTGSLASNNFYWPDPTSPASLPSTDKLHYPGNAGWPDTLTPGRVVGNLILTGADADMPDMNPNQQSNYLLCSESDILGVVNERSFENLDGKHYHKPQSMFRGQKLPYNYNLQTAVFTNNRARS